MGPWAIADHGAPVSSPTLKPHPKQPMKGTRGISWGPLLTPGSRAMPECCNGQSAPGTPMHLPNELVFRRLKLHGATASFA
ncbi:unnamed protein product [Staurois parvus]|uniref:Uncharacterized protein n=1 Tax=Staurois parvus TaxID=386267 RepID=A0ABN9HU90_9NEOB|nr:unnamed protein product [Staurois parvus]